VGEVSDDAAVIVVHDAARPILPEVLVERLLDALAAGFDGAVPALPVSDTVKRIDRGVVAETLDRDGLVTVQTPQAFVAPVLRAALEPVRANLAQATDCAALVEAAGGRVTTVDGDERLLKVTTPADLERVGQWL
jgi:2-C-methyl-D-erythritol 4-phosphate cytidylyltransferase